MKKKSAIFSKRPEFFVFSFLIDKKDKMQLIIKEIVAIAVNSSISDDCFRCSTLRDVSTIKQSPSRFDEVLRM